MKITSMMVPACFTINFPSNQVERDPDIYL